MRFEGRVYRPPSEARSVLIQLTVGCSHNRCAFCAMYSEKKYRVRPLEEVLEDVDHAARTFPRATRIFLCDGDALSAGCDVFEKVCLHINERFSSLERIAAYVNARDILRLSHEELYRLRQLKFSLGYLGLESGSGEVLDLIRKGATPDDMVQMAHAARRAEISLSVIVLLGAGGAALTLEHAHGTIRVVNEMQPKYLSFLTAMIVPYTSLMTWTEQGKFKPMTDRAILQEAGTMLAGLDLQDTLFRMNHVSNLITVGGTLPQDKEKMLGQVGRMLTFAEDKVTCLCSADDALML